MALGGESRESVDFAKKVGVFEANVVAINPTAEEYKDILGMDLKEDSKATDYLSVTAEGVAKVRVDVWLEEVMNKDKFKVSFFLEDSKKQNKDKTKMQYVNEVGVCSWAASTDLLPKFFLEREYRVAMVGEEELITFFRTWLAGLNYKSEKTELMLDWKKVIAGNLREWKEAIGSEWAKTVGALATVKTIEKEDGPKSYQSVYNKAFFPGYLVKNMRLVDYNNMDVVRGLKFKKSAELKPHERFVLNVTGEYGCKEFYSFKEIAKYDPEKNLVESDKVISTEGADY
jgi:hypothetical protein